jgi:predicted DCC family thiol-disulfide oxidoreductase YuxK
MTSAPVLYDPDCGFCRVTLAFLLRWDVRGRLRPVALGT